MIYVADTKNIHEAAQAQIAQLVEQRTENPRVTGSIPVLGTLCASGSVVEHRLAKARVASSNLVSRCFREYLLDALFFCFKIFVRILWCNGAVFYVLL